jgi:hypothetical protein
MSNDNTEESESEDEVTIRREQRQAEFLDNDGNNNGDWSPISPRSGA